MRFDKKGMDLVGYNLQVGLARVCRAVDITGPPGEEGGTVECVSGEEGRSGEVGEPGGESGSGEPGKQATDGESWVVDSPPSFFFSSSSTTLSCLESQELFPSISSTFSSNFLKFSELSLYCTSLSPVCGFTSNKLLMLDGWEEAPGGGVGC